MHTRMNIRRIAGAVTLIATGAAGLAALGAPVPAGAANGPTATLRRGILIVDGSEVRDVMSVAVEADEVTVDFGFDDTIDARFPRSRVQQIRVLGNGGDDGMSVRGTGEMPVTMSGGVGNDFLGALGNIGQTGDGDASTSLSGDDGNDSVLAATPGPITVQTGAGDDFVEGGGAGIGQEKISLGDGNDRFLSQLNSFVGRRSDLVDGGAGRDLLEMEGTFSTESLGLSAASGLLVVDHDFGNRIQADNVEDVKYFGFGGLDVSGSGDAVAVNDLSSTDVVTFTRNFSTSRDSTAPNNSSDTLTVRATPGVDNITVSGAGANITVAGLVPTVTPVFLDSQDFLRIETLAGDDVVDTSGLQPGLVQLFVL